MLNNVGVLFHILLQTKPDTGMMMMPMTEMMAGGEEEAAELVNTSTEEVRRNRRSANPLPMLYVISESQYFITKTSFKITIF